MNIHFPKQAKGLTAFSLTVAAVALLWLALSADGDTSMALAQAGDTPTPEAATEPVDEQGVENFPTSEGKVNLPKYPNVDSNLNRIIEQAQSGQFTAQAAAANAPVHSGASVAVTLYITEGYTQGVWDWLKENGADPRNIGADYIEAYIPVSLLGEASEQEGVISVRTIIPPHPAQGAVVSEGARVHGAPAWNRAGYKGKGVKIGIIDGSFKDFQKLMGTELPSSVQARCYTAVGQHSPNLADCVDMNRPEHSKFHGTGVAEAVFDIAPEATYYIATPRSWGDLSSIANWMASEGVDIINMSLGWSFEGPGDGTTPYSNGPLKSVDAAVARGITWVNSGGNTAQDNWFGQYADANSNNVHDFGATGDECNGVVIQLSSLTGFTAHLRWEDSWGGASSDLDIYLIPVTGGALSVCPPPSPGERRCSRVERTMSHTKASESATETSPMACTALPCAETAARSQTGFRFWSGALRAICSTTHPPTASEIPPKARTPVCSPWAPRLGTIRRALEGSAAEDRLSTAERSRT